MNARRILLVDDEAFLRGAFAEALQAEGHAVAEASCVAEAAALFDEGPFDAVVTDLCLPDGSGLELLARLRARDSQFSAIVTTGFGSFDQAVEAIRLRVSAFLTKPFSMAELLATVAAAAPAPGESARPWSAPATDAGCASLLARLRAWLSQRNARADAAARASALAEEALANAARHAYPHETGRVELAVAEEGDGALSIRVADAGCGFDVAEALARVLAEGRREAGLVRLHRGADSARFDAVPGRGTTVSLRLRSAFAGESQLSAPPSDDELAVALLWS